MYMCNNTGVHVAGGYEKGVQELRQQHSEDVAKVVQDIFSHYYISGRNSLAIKLIVILLVYFVDSIDFFLSLIHI